jgi:hypothetical protein
MFNSTPTILIYIKRNSLLLLDGQASTKLPLPEDAVVDLEVVDATKLTTVCEQFFTAKNLHGKRLLVVLDRAIVFDKIVPLGMGADPGPLVDAFRNSVPIDPGAMKLLNLHKEDKLFLYATNKVLYGTVISVLDRAGVKVFAVTPAAAYKLPSDTESDSQLAATLLSDLATARWANFLSS